VRLLYENIFLVFTRILNLHNPQILNFNN